MSSSHSWVDDPDEIMRRIATARAARQGPWIEGWMLEIHVDLWRQICESDYFEKKGWPTIGDRAWALPNGWRVQITYFLPTPDHEVHLAQWVARDFGQTFVVPVNLSQRGK